MMVLVEVEQNFYKSRQASLAYLKPQELGKTEQSFCQYVVLEQKAFIIEDCSKDNRTSRLIAVRERGVKAYAGLPIRNPEGEILGSFCAFDIKVRTWTNKEISYLTDLRNGIESEIATRLQLIRLDKDSAQLQRHLMAAQQLFSDLEHEVRTPLNAIINLTQGWGEQQLPQSAAQMMATVYQKAKGLCSFMENTLDLASINRSRAIPEPKVSSTSALVEEIEKKAASLSQSAISISCQLEPKMPELLIFDLRRLSQLLSLLIQLHLALGSHKGALKICLSFSKPDLLSIRLSSNSYHLSNEECASIFARGSFSAPPSFPYQDVIPSLIDLLKVRLWAESNRQETTFTIKLNAPQGFKPKQEQPKAKPGLNILAIDDDPANLLVLGHLARRLGHRLHAQKSGREGLDALAMENYDLLLVDLRMPEMDGFEVARAARAMGFKPPIIAVTADTSEQARKQAQESGINDFITKPLKIDILKEAIASLCKL